MIPADKRRIPHLDAGWGVLLAGIAAAILSIGFWPSFLQSTHFACSPPTPPVQPDWVCADGLSYLLPTLQVAVPVLLTGIILFVLFWRFVRTGTLARWRWFSVTAILALIVMARGFAYARPVDMSLVAVPITMAVFAAVCCAVAIILPPRPSRILLFAAAAIAVLGAAWSYGTLSPMLLFAAAATTAAITRPTRTNIELLIENERPPLTAGSNEA
ncbi:MAG TPA: hypothetical protein VNT53_00630 [Pseudolysinimonas sp.]|nr:hypothetical protein [Pseudolysinimonas sp.]